VEAGRLPATIVLYVPKVAGNQNGYPPNSYLRWASDRALMRFTATSVLLRGTSVSGETALKGKEPSPL